MQFIFNLLKLRRERNIINKILENLQIELQSIQYSYILYPIVRILEIIRQTLIIKFITQIPPFPPFTKQQVEEESLQIFNDFLDSLTHKGQLNVIKYIKNSTNISTFSEQLQLATKTKSKIRQPNDFKRQSAIFLKHINGSVKKQKLMNFSDDDKQDSNQTFDLLYIFLGDIHNHKLFEDEEYLYNQIQHMNPDYWRSKYSPIMHRISECIEDEMDESVNFKQNGQCKQDWQQQKQEFCCVLRAICQMALDLFKSLNTATLYYYWVGYSFQKFLNRAQKIGFESAMNLQIFERNYPQHLKDFMFKKSNYVREYRNRLLLDKAEREFIKIILNI